MTEATDKHFAKIYNDKEKFFNLTDVALELGISYQTVRNKASILKGRFRRGEKVPELIDRTVQAVEKQVINPVEHANARAEILREKLHDMITKTRYPVTNPSALVVEKHMSSRYDRRTGGESEYEGTPRTWLSDTLRVEAVTEPAGRRFIFTGAQNDTDVDPDFWQNLQAYAEFMDADIVIGPGTYETQWWAENNPGVRAYSPVVEEFLCFGQMEIGDQFVFSGEMNMLPTATRPVSDLTTYSCGKWTVFPHASIQLKSVPTTDPSKQAHQVMTTGMVTRPKIIPRKAGIKSLSAHTLGATIVEFDSEGDLFCRQITAGDNGAFYDLGNYVANGVVEVVNKLDALVCGDIHTRKMRSNNAIATFGFDYREKSLPIDSTSIVETFKIGQILLHDVFDNEARNHHHVHDNAYSYEMSYRGRDSVYGEVLDAATFLESLEDKAEKIIVVDSNHDVALERYVREGRYRNDGMNIRFGLQLEDDYLSWREECADRVDAGLSPYPFSMFEHAARKVAGDRIEHVGWVHDAHSYLINNVECGHHGYRGANGARGTVAGYAKLGRRMSIADKHSPEIMDGVFVAGTMELQHGYNKGPSGWAVTHIFQYPDGNRTLVTFQNGKWHA